MVFPHTTKKSASKHIELIEFAKTKEIRAPCLLYLAGLLIQSHIPNSNSQKSTNRLAKEALLDFGKVEVSDKKSLRFFKLSCDGMLMDEMYSLLVCVSPPAFNPKAHRIHMLCQDILKQNKNQRRYRQRKSKKRR